MVQTATKLILEPIFEVDFKDCSYGFRPGRDAGSLIWKWLDAGVMEGGHETKLLSGTPQGGPVARHA